MAEAFNGLQSWFVPVLKDKLVQSGRSQSIYSSSQNFQEHKKEFFWHAIPIDVGIKWQSSMKIVVKFMGMFIHLELFNQELIW